MKLIRFLLSLIATAGVVWFLSNPIAKGDTTVPPLGKLFNPFTGFWRNAEPVTGPAFNPNVKLPGLKGKVDVVYDDNMVPHIFAENTLDAVMVQGHITAQHRLFQMDLAARKVAGRLAEVVGERALPIDVNTRRRGLPWAAERDLEYWKQAPEDMALIEAYCMGVNAYIDNLNLADYPVEFKILGHAPEHWTPLKCVMIAEGMADILAVYDQDLEATNAVQLLGAKFYDDMYPAWNPKQKPVIPEGFYPKNPTRVPQKVGPNALSPKMGGSVGTILSQPEAGQLTNQTMPASDFGPVVTDGPEALTDPYILGSNNWALAGSKTASGKAILANDPHLSLSLPSIWFQLQMHTPEANTYGVSLQGIPGVVIGFNEHIAWGITNVGVDVTDWYKINWTDAAHTQYTYDGGTRKAETRIESIAVKGRKEPVLDTVQYTVWGPVVYDDPKEPLSGHALRWAAHDQGPGRPVGNFAKLNKAKNFAEYSAALRDYDCPAQNFVFAALDGDIAIRVQGNMPIRRGDDGRFVQDGSTMATQWNGFIPQDEIPMMHNPARGFVTSANQNSTAPSYPYHAKYGDWEQYRGRNAVDWLENMKGATLDSMKAMQNSNYSLRAHDGLKAMLPLLDRTGLSADEQAYLKELEGWDYRYEKDKTAPSLFDMWLDSTYEATFDEVMQFRKKEIRVQLPPTWRFIELMAKDSNHYVFDNISTPGREAARQVVTAGFKKMATGAAKAALKGELVWGKINALTINHLARIAAFSRVDIPIGGHRSALNAISLGRGYGPSWRMIVDLGSEGVVKGLGVYPGGQSGNPGSKYYDNMVDTWANGQYNDLNFLKDPGQLAGEKVLAKQVFTN
jgi:penicillin G amidase